MTYGFKASPQEQAGDKVVATALNGVVYTENKRIHVKGNDRHFVYKFDGSPIGWYARNIKNGDEISLGVGASPTIEFENLQIKNAVGWEAICQPETETQEE